MFQIGDRVRVRNDSRFESQRGLVGVIIEITEDDSYPIDIKYDNRSRTIMGIEINNYESGDLELLEPELEDTRAYLAVVSGGE